MNFGVGHKADDDDPVIATYNVYASQSLQNHLHIFQFPLRRKMRPYEASDVRLFATEGLQGDNGEPQQQQQQQQQQSPLANASASEESILTPFSRLTMHCRLDTFGSSSFDETKQEAQQQQQQQRQVQQQSRKHSYSYALQSHPFQPRCDYAIGFISDGSVHLTPVSTVQQFTPIVQPNASSLSSSSFSFSHCGAHRVDSAFASAASTPLVPGLALSDRIQRDLTRQRSAVLNADAATAREINSFGTASVESIALRRRLRSATVESTALYYPTHSHSARAEDSLFPPELLVSGGILSAKDSASPTSPTSPSATTIIPSTSTPLLLRRYASRHSTAAQVAAHMRSRQVTTLSALRMCITPPDTDEALLSALRTEAVWAHGVWIARRSPSLTGAVAALRELVILRLCESPNACVARAQLNALVCTAPLRRAVREVLLSVAELVAGEADPTRRVWRLRQVPGDTGGLYPQEILFQRAQWARLGPLIESHRAAVHAGVPVARLFLTLNSRSDTGPTTTTIIGGGGGGGGSLAQSANVREENIAPIVRYVRRLFLEHGVLNKQRAKEMVLKAKPRHFPDATNAMLSAALQQSVQAFTGATWVLKARGEPEVDRHRPLILEAVLELTNFEARSLNALLAEKRERLGIAKEDDEDGLQKIVSCVLSEVAEFKTHERLWRLKSGNVVAE